MTYSLHTLTHSPSSAEGAAQPRNFWARFAHEISLLVGAGLVTVTYNDAGNVLTITDLAVV